MPFDAILEIHASAMPLGHAAHDREAQSRPAFGRGLAAIEAVEDARALLDRDAWPGVLHFEDRPGSITTHAHANRSGRRVANRVVDQILDQRPQSHVIAID